MASYVISSGATSAFALQSGDTLVVSSAGESESSTVGSGAREIILAGGSSLYDTIASGGLLTLSSAGTAASVQVSSGGTIQAGAGMLDGYNVVAGHIVSGQLGGLNTYGEGAFYGDLEISSGGLVQDLNIVYGAAEIQAGGSAVSVSLQGAFADTYATLVVDAGAKATFTQVGNQELVDDYGVISQTTVSGGMDYVYGSSISTNVAAYGDELVQSGGLALDSLIEATGSQTVSSGGLASKTVISSGGTFILSQGGVARSVTVKSGGTGALGLVVSSGQTISEGGFASALTTSTTISGVALQSGAYLSALDPVIESGGVLVQAAGAIVSGVAVEAGGRLSGGDIAAGYYYGDENTDAGIVISVTLISDEEESGLLHVFSGGLAESVNVDDDSALDVQSGGSASAIVVSGLGSLLSVEAGGYVHSAAIGGMSATSGQSATIFGSSVDDSIKLGGVELVGSGGLASRTTVSSGGEQIVLSGGDAVGTAVRAGGEIVLELGASASGGVVSSGGVAVTTLDLTSGQSFELPAGVATATESLDGLTISSGGGIQITDATVESGGKLYLEGNVLSSGVTVSAGGLVEGAGTLLGSTEDQGVAEILTLGAGGFLDVASGGVVKGVTVLAGEMSVDSGGLGSNVTISSAGVVDVGSGGSATLIQVRVGGDLSVVTGANLTSATVSSGAALTISQGSIASGVTVVAGIVAATTASGGATVLAGGILNRADTIVSSGGLLALGSGGDADSLIVSAGATVSGLGELTGATFNSGTVSGVTLAGFLQDSGRVHGLHLASGAVLQVQGVAASDVASSGASVLVQSGGAASSTVLLSGASQTVLSGGASDLAVVSSGGAQVVSSGGVDSGTVVKAGGSETLYGGAVTSAITVSSGGTVILEDAVVSSGQTVVLRATGSAMTVDGVSALAGATLEAKATIVSSGGVLSLASGASYDDVRVLAGGKLIGPGNLGDTDVVPTGRTDSSLALFFDAGLISGVTVGLSAQARLSVLEGGVADDITDYASIEVASGGTISGVTLDAANAVLGVDLGAVASRVTVEMGEAVIVGSADIVTASGGSLVAVNGLATSVSIGSNGELWVEAGGAVSGATIASGGTLLLDVNGSMTSGTVASGGALVLDDEYETLLSGHTLSVGAVAATTTVDGVVIAKGGRENVINLDVASGATVSFGSGGALGFADILSGAVVKGPGVIFGASEIYGTVSGITIEADPDFNPLPYLLDESPLLGTEPLVQVIESGGAARSLTVGSGGNVELMSGGSVTNYVVGASGTLTAIGSITSGQVQSGGELVLQGATVASATVLAGGVVVEGESITISSGMRAVQGVQTALTTVGGTLISSGGIVDYALTSVLSGGVMSLNASALIAGIDQYDHVLVYKGGVVSGEGAYDGNIDDSGLVSGVTLGNDLSPFGTNAGNLYIYSGGAASAVTLLHNASLDVASGGRVVNVVVDGGADGSTVTGQEYVSSGGAASGGTVLSNGSAVFAYGAVVTGVTVSSGGYVDVGFGVSAGQTVSVASNAPTATVVIDGVTLKAGAHLTLDGIVVSSGGLLSLGSAATAGGVTVSYGGVVTGGILADVNNTSTTVYGLLKDAQLGGGSYPENTIGTSGVYREALDVGSGGVGSNLTLVAGEVDIASGGRVAGLQVEAFFDNNIQVDSGGLLEGAVLDASPASDVMQVVVYGSAMDDAIGSGATEVVQGGVDTGAVIRNGGKLLLNDGVVSGATILSGGVFSNAYGQAEAIVVSSGGHDQVNGYTYVEDGEILLDGAVASTTVISGVTLLKGAIADYGGQVSSGGTLSVGVGGQAQELYVFGGLVTGQGALMDGGENYGEIDSVTLYGLLSDGGITSGIHIANGGDDELSSGATARGDYIQAGGLQSVSAGASATAEQVLSGGHIVVSGGYTSGVTVSSGGSATVQTVVSSGATQVFAEPTSAAANFGSLKLASGATGTLQSAAVLGGGRLVLSAGVVVAGGVYEAISDYVGTFVNAGVTVYSGGVLSGAGGVAGVLTVSSGGIVSGISVVSGGTDMVEAGARQSAVQVQSGANLFAVGLTVSTAIVAGVVSATETVAGASVSSGAAVTMSGGAVAKGGSLQVLNGGSVADIATASGGVLIDNGSVIFDQADSTTLAGNLSGSGSLYLSGAGTDLALSGAGAHFSGSAIISGGYIYSYQTGLFSSVDDVLEIATSGGLGTAAVTFDGNVVENTSATLQVDAADTPASGATFANALKNFNTSTDYLDLRGLTYSAGASVSVTGSIMTLTDGARTEKFNLTGQTAGAFTVSNDGHGGVLISPTAAPAGQTLTNAVVETPRVATVSSSGMAKADAVQTGGVEQSASTPAKVAAAPVDRIALPGWSDVMLGETSIVGGRAALFDPATARFAQALAAFEPAGGLSISPISSAAAATSTLFLHGATASASHA